MKNLKFSFAAIIAVVALGFTIAAQAGAFETKAVRVADCFRPTVELKNGCPAGEPAQVLIGAACSSVQLNDHIYDLSTTLIDPTPAVCNSGQFICCFRIVAETSTACSDQPTIDPEGSLPSAKYKVSQVFCKSTNN
ncbi:hypothetical protein [Chitinophaga caseinilytica]|uniref:Hydrophobin n=1 Tax=Chitinophaga caseinilytica TaxID=2267521 RepID=A0ABZ2ZBS0_9BACT